MKRSEMVEVIKKQIESVWGPEDSWYEASCILHRIEEAGMLPPSTSLKTCSEPELQIWSGDNIDIPHWIIHGWDNE